MCYIGVCLLVGSLSVMSVKAIGIALKLTLLGMNQLVYPQTWAFTLIVLLCVITQMNYTNKKSIISTDSNEAVEDHVKDHEASTTQDHHTSEMKGGQLNSLEECWSTNE
ncbi:putative magnesium transporter NIPA [Helianthus anomalus]